MSSVPGDLKYTSSHEWIKYDGEIVTVGITDHAQEELGDVVYVDLPNVGRVLQVGESFGSIESVKAVSEIYAPVAGEVVEVNPSLNSQSDLINSDPYAKGFLVKIKVSDPAAGAGELLSASDYEKSVN